MIPKWPDTRAGKALVNLRHALLFKNKRRSNQVSPARDFRLPSNSKKQVDLLEIVTSKSMSLMSARPKFDFHFHMHTRDGDLQQKLSLSSSTLPLYRLISIQSSPSPIL